MNLQPAVVSAVFWRSFTNFFTNPIGYLFITAFLCTSSYWAFVHQDAFFTNNFAELAELNPVFPYLMLLFVPAITMGVWAEERRSGTEELLLTLPGNDMSIVLGKTLGSVVNLTLILLYTAICHLFVLISLGEPDIGLFWSTYFGYWLVGVALVPTGMLASLFSRNVTVAFIWGILLCTLFVGMEFLLPFFSSSLSLTTWQPRGNFIESFATEYSLPKQLEPFSRGLISFSGILFFLSIAFTMIYLNMIFLSRRHWGGSEHETERWFHYLSRAVCILVAVAAVNQLTDNLAVSLSADMTADRLYTLSPTTYELIDQLDEKRPVLIEAYVAPESEVPANYRETRRNLVDMLKRLDEIGGNKVVVRLIETELFSTAANDAEKFFQITPQRMTSVDQGQIRQVQFVLGVAFKCGTNQQTIPFFYRKLPVEYELVRKIQTVSQKKRKKVGIMTTDAQVFGNFNFRSGQRTNDWQIVDEIRQQYEVERVNPDTEISRDLAALVVPMASSLTQPQLNNLTRYIRDGGPTLIFDDPMPLMVDSRLAARAQKIAPQQNPMFGGQPPSVPKGDINQLVRMLNLRFDSSQVIFQMGNPYPKFDFITPEWIFIDPRLGNEQAFNQESSITTNMQQVLALYPGSLASIEGDGPEVTPLLRTSQQSGTIAWDQVIRRNFLFEELNPSPPRRLTRKEYVLAMHIEGKALFEPAGLNDPPPPPDAAGGMSPGFPGGFPGIGNFEGDGAAEEEGNPESAAADAPTQPGSVSKRQTESKEMNVIFVADLDMMSDALFSLRRGDFDEEFDPLQQLDNYTFVLNCVDKLTGEADLIELRKRNIRRRQLKYLIQMTEVKEKEAAQKRQEAKDNAEKALEAAQKQVDEATQKIDQDQSLDELTKQQQKQYILKIEQNKLDRQREQIEKDREQQLRRIDEEVIRDRKGKTSTAQHLAMLIPPIPVLLIGLLVFLVRMSNENEGVDPRRLR